MPRVDAEDLRAFAERVLTAAGLAEDDVPATADGLVAASVRGVDSHGVFRLPQYVDCLQRGEINARPRVRLLDRRGATALVDADGGYGFRPSLLAGQLAVENAASSGIGLVGVRNSHHFGMAAIYTIRISEAGMIGLVTTTGVAIMAPPGGARPVVGNNPISCAVPRTPPHPPIVLDMALSEVAFGKIRLAAVENRPIPLGWAFDARGRPTTDPEEALRGGLLAPTGQHKGYGLSVIVEVLAGILTGSPFATAADAHGHREGGVGHIVISINPGAFGDTGRFYDGVEQLVAQIKAVPLAEGAAGVFLPGEPESNTAQVRLREGVPVSAELAERLGALAKQLGVAEPSWR
jgi:LDH2 family malate/lactate/ureidoglycolate dehydrogenase